MTRTLPLHRERLDWSTANAHFWPFHTAVICCGPCALSIALLLHCLDVKLWEVKRWWSCLDILFCLGVGAEQLQKVIEIWFFFCLFLTFLPVWDCWFLRLCWELFVVIKCITLRFRVPFGTKPGVRGFFFRWRRRCCTFLGAPHPEALRTYIILRFCTKVLLRFRKAGCRLASLRWSGQWAER